MSKMSLQRYIAASITGMLPTQGLHAYFGSTLRSMEEVISTSSGSSTAYVVFGAQVNHCKTDYATLNDNCVMHNYRLFTTVIFSFKNNFFYFSIFI